MSRLLDRLWRRPLLSTRIAGAMVLALVLIHALVFLQFVLLREQEWSVYGLRWLANAAKQSAAVAFSEPPERRAAALKGLEASRYLKITWSREGLLGPNRSGPPTEPGKSAGRPSFKSRIRATLQQALGSEVSDLRVMLGPGGPPGPPPGPPPGRALIYRPPELEQQLAAGALADNEPEIAIPGRFRVEIQGRDGSWLTLAPIDDDPPSRIWHWPVLPLAGGTVIVALLSLLTARRVLAPLGVLVHAAERLGTQREPVPISTAGLGELTAIADAFNDMQARLKRFVDERTQILAAVSHDLRTSLTRLELEAEELPQSEQKSAIVRELGEMEAMIAATLSFASDDAKAERSRSIDIASLLISLCDEHADAGYAVQYAGPDHASLICQPLAMKRALTNIIDNAVKYGSAARVSLRMTDEAADIDVEDEGPGIPPDRMEEVFMPFRRLETSRSRATGGAGLGLTIARDVLHAHGGSITLRNGDPKGLVVALTVPVPSGNVGSDV